MRDLTRSQVSTMGGKNSKGKAPRLRHGTVNYQVLSHNEFQPLSLMSLAKYLRPSYFLLNLSLPSIS